MKRLFNFKTFVLNEKRAQLKIPFPGTDEKGKMHHDHILDAFDDNQVMKPEAYKSSANVDPLIREAIPGATKMLYDEPERMKNQILDFIYQNIEDNTNYWTPEFFKSNDIDTEEDDFFEDIHDEIADGMVSDMYSGRDGYDSELKDVFTDEGKEAWDEFLTGKIDDDLWPMWSTVEDSIGENDGLISVWRAITYTKGEYDDIYDEITKEHHGGVGQYWSWEENAAEAHWGDSGGKLFVLHGQVRPEDVNWEQSVLKNVYDLREEQELELNDNAKVKLVGMSTSDENGKDVFIAFDPEYVLKV